MHSYNSNLAHIIFATKERRRYIAPEIRDRLWAYLGGTARQLRMKALVVGGVEDHVHGLVSLPSTICIAEAVQKLKANSSRWVHETFPQMRFFDWQTGYAAFSVGISQVDRTLAYIRNQEKHHRHTDFREELARMLKVHGLELQDEL